MTPEDTPGSEAMEQARAYVEIAVEHGQPRRYIARRLHDGLNGHQLNQRQVAEALDVGVATVNRDLEATKKPWRHTKDGTPTYPPGRFDMDDEYWVRVEELARDMPRLNAREEAARQFAGPVFRPGMRGQTERIRTDAQQAELQQAAIKAAS